MTTRADGSRVDGSGGEDYFGCVRMTSAMRGAAGGGPITGAGPAPSWGIAQAALAPLRATRSRFMPSLSATSAGNVPSWAVANRPALMLSPSAT